MVWALCGEVAWYRGLWSEELRQRVDRPEPLPADAARLLAEMRAAGSQR